MDPVNVLTLSQQQMESVRDPERHHHHHHHHHHLQGVHHFSMAEGDHHHPLPGAQFVVREPQHFVIREELGDPQSLMALAGGIGVVPPEPHEDHQVNKLELRWTEQGFCDARGEQPGMKEVGRWEPSPLYDRNPVLPHHQHVVEGTHHVVLQGDGGGTRWEDPSLCDGNEEEDVQNDGEAADGKRSGNNTREVRWTEQALCDALQAVKSGTLTAYKASKDYGIPRSTLRNWLNGRNRSRKRGPRVDEALSFCRQDAGDRETPNPGSLMSDVAVNSGEEGPGSDGREELWQKRKQHAWTRNTLLEALSSVRSGELSVSKAAQVYGIPNSTLDYWMKEHEKKASEVASASSLQAFDGFGIPATQMLPEEDDDEDDDEDEEEDEAGDEQMPGEKKERLKKKAREGKKRVGGWTEKALSDAMDAIKNNTLTICKASRAYGIPRTTLRNWITGRTRSRKRGPHTGLPFESNGEASVGGDEFPYNEPCEEENGECEGKRGGKSGKWSEQALLDAVEAVRSGGSSSGSAAQQFGAPRPPNGVRRKSPGGEAGNEHEFEMKESDERSRKSNGWTEQALQNALQAIRNGFSIRKAGQHYGIPRTTLRNWLNGRTHSRKRGPHGGMTRGEQESAIVEWFFSVQQVSQSLTTLSSLRRRVSTLSVNKGSPFKDGIPVKKWWVWFNRRHPDVAARVGEGLQEAQNRNLIDELSVVHMVTGEHLQILRRKLESEQEDDRMEFQRGEDMDSCSQEEQDDHQPSGSGAAGVLDENHHHHQELVENGMMNTASSEHVMV